MIYIVIKYDKIIMKMSKHQTVQIQTSPSDFKSKTISFYPFYPLVPPQSEPWFHPNFTNFSILPWIFRVLPLLEFRVYPILLILPLLGNRFYPHRAHFTFSYFTLIRSPNKPLYKFHPFYYNHGFTPVYPIKSRISPSLSKYYH